MRPFKWCMQNFESPYTAWKWFDDYNCEITTLLMEFSRWSTPCHYDVTVTPLHSQTISLGASHASSQYRATGTYHLHLYHTVGSNLYLFVLSSAVHEAVDSRGLVLKLGRWCCAFEGLIPLCKVGCQLSDTNSQTVHTALHQNPIRLQYQEETNKILIEKLYYSESLNPSSWKRQNCPTYFGHYLQCLIFLPKSFSKTRSVRVTWYSGTFVQTLF